jgi:hypothetical protein
MRSVAQQVQAHTVVVHWPSAASGVISSDEQIHFVAASLDVH